VRVDVCVVLAVLEVRLRVIRICVLRDRFLTLAFGLRVDIGMR
jgi:hypothetical protein